MSDVPHDPPFPPLISPAPPRRAWRGLVLALLLAFVVGVGAAVIGARYYARWTATRTVSAPVSQQQQQPPVVIVPAQLPKAGAAAPVIDLGDLSTREGQLSQQLADLEARTASVGQSAAAASGNATRAEGMLIAFAARRQLDKGLPLGYLDGQLAARFGQANAGAVNTVRQAAAAPVTLEDLRAGLDAIAPDLVTGAGNLGWVASLRRELSGLIVLHKANTPSPLPAERLARARRLLDAAQVAPALAEVARLPGAPQAENWMVAAKRYLAARQSLDVIETAAIAGTPTPPSLPTVPAG